MGTVICAALIIAIINFLRLCLEYIDQKTKGTQNEVTKAIICATRCCLWCLEKCMDKVSKNALIWTAIYGDNFAQAACNSFKLLWRNAMRVAAISVVSEYLLLFGKLFVAVCTTLVAALIYENDPYRSEVGRPTIVLLLM